MTMVETASQRVRRLADKPWRDQFTHPFITGIGDGTLEMDKFTWYLAQDYVYLIDYARVFGYLAARAPELRVMKKFTELMATMLEGEMALHRSITSDFGITTEQLESTRKAPTNQGYTDFLIRVASSGEFAEAVSALLPCMWVYSDLGIHLYNQGLPENPHYAQWITAYAAPEFVELTEWTKDLLDEYSANAPAAMQKRIDDAFVTCTRYELAFWEMAWTKQRWLDEE
jgi:thiaminase/transcriptional activator TenA